MVSRLLMEALARRYDTAMSRAMLRALGAPQAGAPRPSRGPVVPRGRRYRGVRRCFANEPEPAAWRYREPM